MQWPSVVRATGIQVTKGCYGAMLLESHSHPCWGGVLSLRVTCLPIESTYLFCWIILLASVQADGPCPEEASVCGLEGDDPSTVPLHLHPQALHLVKRDLLAVPLQPMPLQFSWPGVSFCRPNSSSFKTLSSDNSFFRRLPCSLGWAAQGCLWAPPRFPHYSTGAHSCHHLLSGCKR